jgi:hypothetical protein
VKSIPGQQSGDWFSENKPLGMDGEICKWVVALDRQRECVYQQRQNETTKHSKKPPKKGCIILSIQKKRIYRRTRKDSIVLAFSVDIGR